MLDHGVAFRGRPDRPDVVAAGRCDVDSDLPPNGTPDTTLHLFPSQCSISGFASVLPGPTKLAGAAPTAHASSAPTGVTDTSSQGTAGLGNWCHERTHARCRAATCGARTPNATHATNAAETAATVRPNIEVALTA